MATTINVDLRRIWSKKTEMELYQLAFTDALTNVYNRNALEEMRKQIDSAYVYVAMVDIDDLKTINDTQGHCAGDTAIKEVADKLTCISEFVFRLGGDEFLLISTQSIINATIPGASIGCIFKPSCMSLSEAMKAADYMLYEAKRDRKIPLPRFCLERGNL